MRRPQGNIIITALFVAVFLFFLSVALVWTNRQDIALVLSMEHKTKAEAAARSGAMIVYATLRETGRAPTQLAMSLKSGASWRVQLVRVEAEGKRGPVLLVRSRGQSGPLSSYFTLHLLETELSSPSAGKSRLLVFAGSSAGSSQDEPADDSNENPSSSRPQRARPAAITPEREEESGKPGSTASQTSSSTVIPPDFIPTQAQLGLPSRGAFAASDGPIFASEPASTSEREVLSVVDAIPVFSTTGGSTRAFGPALIALQAPADRTQLRVLRKSGEDYEWETIPDPTGPESDNLAGGAAPLGRVDLAVAGPGWTALTVRSLDGHGVALKQSEFDSHEGTPIASFEAVGDREWQSSSSAAITAVSLRGAIVSQGEVVYSHAWKYLYLPYTGSTAVPPLSVQIGSRILRWPCVVRHKAGEKDWTVVWDPLKDSGELTSQTVPDPTTLWVDSKAGLYALNLDRPQELIKLNADGSVSSVGAVNDRKLVVYNDTPYTVSQDPAKPGLTAVSGDARIDFETLPKRIPAVAGPWVVPPPAQVIGYDMSELEISKFDDSPQPTELRTFLAEVGLDFEVSDAEGLAACGDDLYARLKPNVEILEPTIPMAGAFEHGTPASQVLARFDGRRWHILPNGLLAALRGGQRLNSPDGRILCARYEGLPNRAYRYTVISLSCDPFEFQ